MSSAWQDERWPTAPCPPRPMQTGFRVLLTLAGAATGLYLVLTGGQNVVYLGPIMGVAGWYGFLGPLWRAARNLGATHWQMVRHEETLDTDSE